MLFFSMCTKRTESIETRLIFDSSIRPPLTGAGTKKDENKKTTAVSLSTSHDTFSKGVSNHLFTRVPLHIIDEERPELVKMEVNTHIANHIDRINIDGFAKSLLEDTFPEWMPKPLRIELKESLRGFNEWAAL